MICRFGFFTSLRWCWTWWRLRMFLIWCFRSFPWNLPRVIIRWRKWPLRVRGLWWNLGSPFFMTRCFPKFPCLFIAISILFFLKSCLTLLCFCFVFSLFDSLLDACFVAWLTSPRFIRWSAISSFNFFSRTALFRRLTRFKASFSPFSFVLFWRESSCSLKRFTLDNSSSSWRRLTLFNSFSKRSWSATSNDLFCNERIWKSKKNYHSMI